MQFGTDTLPDLPFNETGTKSDDAVATLSNKSSEDEELDFVSLENLLNCGDDNTQKFTLPIHMRCAAHTFNLIASKDADAALQITGFKTSYRNAMGKARALWNQQSSSTVAAHCIHTALGRMLVVPNTSTWNSTYDALV